MLLQPKFKKLAGYATLIQIQSFPRTQLGPLFIFHRVWKLHSATKLFFCRPLRRTSVLQNMTLITPRVTGISLIIKYRNFGARAAGAGAEIFNEDGSGVTKLQLGTDYSCVVTGRRPGADT